MHVLVDQETCNSTTASSGGTLDNTRPFGDGSPGRPTSPNDDYYEPSSCEKELADDSCVESCIKTEWSSPSPWYGVGPNGTDYQEYTSNVVNKCMRLCQRK
jgi:hypothetical protein